MKSSRRLNAKQRAARDDKVIVRAERGIFDLFAKKAHRTIDPKTGTVTGYIPDKPDHFRDA